MPLSPSQRIHIIKSIAERLLPEEWPLIDLTLKQFGLPWTDNWSDSKQAYILQMISDASAETLIELAVHVGVPVSESTPRIEPPFWRPGMLRVFLSHLSAHGGFAASLQQACEPFGLSCFVAHNDIEPTTEWQSQIETALGTCDTLVALLHPTFHSSNWTDQEIGFAMGRGVPTFSIMLGQEPYGFIGRFQAFNGHSKTAAQLARDLFDAYRKNKQTQSKMAGIVIGLFEHSHSFANSKMLVGLVESLETWEPSFSARLESAVKNNSQVNGSWGVPERVAKLVAKWGKSGG